MIGETLESTGQTLAAGGDKIEKTVQKVVAVVEEETAKTELPGVVTLLTSGTSRVINLLMGDAPPNPDPFVEKPQKIAEDTTVHAKQNMVGDIITTSIETGISQHDTGISHSDYPTQLDTGILHSDPTQLGVVKGEEAPLPPQEIKGPIDVVQGAQLPPQEIKGPIDVVLIHPHQEATKHRSESEPLLPNLTKKHVHDAAMFMNQAEHQKSHVHHRPVHHHTVHHHAVHSQPTEMLPNLTKKDVHDASMFMKQAEHQNRTVHSQPRGKEAERQLDLPKLGKEEIHDATEIVDQVENLDISQGHKQDFSQQKNIPDNVQAEQQKISDSIQKIEGGKGSSFPNLTTKDVHDSGVFLDTLENSSQ
jgi:hypothetical protein